MHDTLPSSGTIRKLWVTEVEQYREHLLRLDGASRRSRFGGAVADEFVAQYATKALSLDAVIHGFFVEGVLRGAAELRAVRSDVDADAEAAFSIEEAWQSHGVGSALLEQTLLVARNRGIRTLHMICLAENTRMQQLAKKFDAELSFEYGSVVGEVETPFPTPLSVMREIVADSHGFATAMLEVQSRMLQRAARRRR